MPEGPKRNYEQDQAKTSHHAFAPTGYLREMAEDDGADDRSAIVNDGDVGACGCGELMYFLEKIRIQVLRAVGEEHHEGHQDHKIGETLPFAGHDAKDFAGAGGPVLLPGSGLRHFGTNVEGEERRSRASPEHGAPAESGQQKSRSYSGQ